MGSRQHRRIAARRARLLLHVSVHVDNCQKTRVSVPVRLEVSISEGPGQQAQLYKAATTALEVVVETEKLALRALTYQPWWTGLMP